MKLANKAIAQITKSVEDSLNQLDIELVEIEYRREHGDQMLRIFIDHEAGVNLDLCSEATRAVKDLIDVADISYDHLEVSSPGLDRKIIKGKAPERFIGQRIKAKTIKEYDGPKKLVGILSGLDDDYIHIESEHGNQVIPWKMITVVRLDPEL